MGICIMARTRKRVVRMDHDDERQLKKHSKSKTPVKVISKALKPTPGTLRQKARRRLGASGCSNGGRLAGGSFGSLG
jgi:hypothetical protein